MAAEYSTSADRHGRGATPADKPRDVFVTTHWSVVLAAARSDTTRAQEALATLCQTYWRPLYAYARRHTPSSEDAEDIVQGFFAFFLEKNRLGGLSSEQGRFRAFLLASLKNYLANERNRVHRQKRGGHATHLSLDWQDAEHHYQLDPADHLTPDRIYDREWALTLLDRVFQRLRAECAAEGKADQFERLKGHLTLDRTEIPYAEAAREIGLEEGAVRVMVHRLRKRYRNLVREEVGQTLATPGQVEEEMQALFMALRG